MERYCSTGQSPQRAVAPIEEESIPALGPIEPPIQWVPDLPRGLRRPGRGADHPPPPTANVQERVELYIYSPSGPSWPVVG
jgi:hypothetical protein